MAKQSTQHKLDRVRPPRVHVTYDVEIGDAIELKELPFVMGVLGDFTGQPIDPLPRLRDRKFTEVNPDNFDSVLEGMKPHLAFSVENKLSEDSNAPQLKVDLHFKSMDDFEPENVARAMRRDTKLVWVETPSNPLLRVVDIEAVAAIAHHGGALCAVDNTWGTPALQRPLELGADISMHSTTKYLGGHSDVLSGALIVRDDRDLYQRINTVQIVGGAVPSPFECWLAMRGIRTMPLRVRAQTASAGELAKFLAEHPCVERVHYPGLSSHAGHAVAARQMSGFGGMLSVQAGKNREQSLAVASRLKIFTQATSLGGTESLVEHRASVEGPGTRAPENLLRISVGLENVADLIEDFDSALDRLNVGAINADAHDVRAEAHPPSGWCRRHRQHRDAVAAGRLTDRRFIEIIGHDKDGAGNRFGSQELRRQRNR